MTAPRKYLTAFDRFIRDMRIKSKENTSGGARGSRFNLWMSQRMFVEGLANALDEGVHTFKCLKSRQVGITTVSLALVDLFWLATHPNMIGALVTDTEKNRDANRALLRGYIESFPPGFFGRSFSIVKGQDNRKMMGFSNGSRLDFLVAGTTGKGTSWGEGVGYALAHLTEVAAYGNPAGLKSFEEALAQANPDRLFVYESTAKGFNHWKDSWDEAGRDNLTQRRIFIGWWACETNRIESNDPRFPVYGRRSPDEVEREKIKKVAELYGVEISMEQLAWFRWRESDTSNSEHSLRQNQPWTETEAFVQSGHSFFQVRVIGNDLETAAQMPYRGYRYLFGDDFHLCRLERIMEIERQDEIELRVWEEPKSHAQYVIGCDPAFGRNDFKDRHAISVWRCFADRMVQVAEFATPECETRHCAWALAHLGGAYANCLVNLELSGPGRLVMQEWIHLRDRMNADFLKPIRDEMGWEDFLSHARWYLYHRPDSMGAGYAYNWETTASTAPRLWNRMRDSYATGLLSIASVPMLKEMAFVVQDGAHIGAPDGTGQSNKDDRVFAGALANWAWVEWLRLPMIHRGATYEEQMRAEMGEANAGRDTVSGIVYRYLQRAGVEPEPPEPPAWMRDRGLA